MQQRTPDYLNTVFDTFNKLHVVIVGDVMLDKYWWGEVDRISPEAPVPVVSLLKRETRLGGAANVALNCKALGAKVTLASVIGDDDDAYVLEKICQEKGIATELIIKSKNRKTTSKTRVISRTQQLLRLDDEIADDLITEDEHPFIDNVLRFLQITKPDAVIFEDYNKGVLKKNVIDRLLAHCKELNLITGVDPKKKNFMAYKGVTIFKPNLKEVRDSLTISNIQPDKASLGQADKELRKAFAHEITFITLSEQGVYFNDGKNEGIVASHLRNIADVSGAGDTVMATAVLVYAATKDVALMAGISNIAGGLVCEQVGVVPIEKQSLKDECLRLLYVQH